MEVNFFHVLKQLNLFCNTSVNRYWKKLTLSCKKAKILTINRKSYRLIESFLYGRFLRSKISDNVTCQFTFLSRMSFQSYILFPSPGAMGAGTFILAAGYAKTATVAVTCMCIGVAASGLMHSGYNVNMLDIAPRYACVIMGLTNTVGTITGFLSPMMVGYITVNKVGIKQLRTRST